MINQSDVLIAYATYTFGNTHKYVHYALAKYKDCINLDDNIFQGKRLQN